MGPTEYGEATHVGRVREHNEDAYVADPERGIWIVADGMGGHRGGEVASRIVADYVHEALVRGGALPEAVARAHEVVCRAAEDGLGQAGMGSTVVALQLRGAVYRIAWVGDSRAYLWSGGRLRQLTRDHSLVQRMLDEGQISSADAAVHPYRNVITQALGAADLPAVDVGEVQGTLHRGDCLMLCSDGLCGEVPLEEMQDVLAGSADGQARAEALVQAALRHGGSDNITVLVVAAPADAPAGPASEPIAEDEPTGRLDVRGTDL